MKKTLFFTLCLAVAGVGIAMEPEQAAPRDPNVIAYVLAKSLQMEYLALKDILSKIPTEGILDAEQQSILHEVISRAQKAYDRIAPLNKKMADAFTDIISDATERFNQVNSAAQTADNVIVEESE
jgi:hypothetical protein